MIFKIHQKVYFEVYFGVDFEVYYNQKAGEI